MSGQFIKYLPSFGKFAQSVIQTSDVSGLDSQLSTLSSHIGNTSNPHNVTKSQIGLENVTNDAQLTRGPSDFLSFPTKTTPSSSDILLIEDSNDGYQKKRILLSQVGGSSSSGVNFIPKDVVTVTGKNFELPSPLTQNVHLVDDSSLSENFSVVYGNYESIDSGTLSFDPSYTLEFICPWDILLNAFSPFDFTYDVAGLTASIQVYDGNSWIYVIDTPYGGYNSEYISLPTPFFIKAFTPVRVTANLSISYIPSVGIPVRASTIAYSYSGSSTGSSEYPYWGMTLYYTPKNKSVIDVTIPSSYQNDLVFLSNSSSKEVDYLVTYDSQKPPVLLEKNKTVTVTNGKIKNTYRHYFISSSVTYNDASSGTNLLNSLWAEKNETFDGLLKVPNIALRYDRTLLRFRILYDNTTYPNSLVTLKYTENSIIKYKRFEKTPVAYGTSIPSTDFIFEGEFFFSKAKHNTTDTTVGLYIFLDPAPTSTEVIYFDLELICLPE